MQAFPGEADRMHATLAQRPRHGRIVDMGGERAGGRRVRPAAFVVDQPW